MQPTLRAANVTEARRVAEVLVASRREFLPFAAMVHSVEEVEQWVRTDLISVGAVTVALIGGEIVGVLALSTENEITWVDQLYIHPLHVGQGIGSALLSLAVVAAPASVRLYTFQQNNRARTFYERHGFVAVEFGDGSTNEEKCPDVMYERAASKNAV
jgi:GNAT superfamily N-acetyltransferase